MNKELKIKVCGMRDRDNVSALQKLSPDRIGLIFYPPSKRYVGSTFSIDQFNNNDSSDWLSKEGNSFTGVFVNTPVDSVDKLAKANRIGSIQLHGQELPTECSTLINRGYEVIKAFSVDSDFDFSVTEEYEECCSYFLFDTKGKQPGGNGEKFSWNILQEYRGETPFFLSGGVRESDLDLVESFAHPKFAGIDLNSGFETEPAQKDIESLERFIKALKKI